MANLVKVAQAAAARFGIEVRRAGRTMTNHQQRSMLLDRLGVTLVLDAGANVGQYAGVHLRQWTAYTGRIASFEPVSASYIQCAQAAQTDPLWDTYPYGLSDASATVPILVPEGQSDLSSLHPPTKFGSRLLESHAIRTEQVEVRRLDDVIDQIARPDDVLALKLDVQGHEAAVLRGSTRTLERVVLVECELPLVAVYQDQATFEEMMAAFSNDGFMPVGLSANCVDPTTGFAVDADVFFAHDIRD